MTIEALAKQGYERTYTGLAGIDARRLKSMRNAALRACFNRMEETRYKQEFVARVCGRQYVNDAASRTINATWYTLEHQQGGIIWIADANDIPTDYSRLVPTALRKVRMLVVVGDGEDYMHHIFNGIIPVIKRSSTIAEALRNAYRYDSEEELSVVYSPACYNGHSTVEEGDTFRKEVNEL